MFFEKNGTWVLSYFKLACWNCYQKWSWPFWMQSRLSQKVWARPSVHSRLNGHQEISTWEFSNSLFCTTKTHHPQDRDSMNVYSNTYPSPVSCGAFCCIFWLCRPRGWWQLWRRGFPRWDQPSQPSSGRPQERRTCTPHCKKTTAVNTDMLTDLTVLPRCPL